MSVSQEPLRKRILLALNIDLIVQHLLRYVSERNLEHIGRVFDEERPSSSLVLSFGSD